MRDDETGKRSLFGSGDAGRENDGDESRRNLFSAPIGVDCARCGASTRIGVMDALGRLVRLSLWVPGRTYPRRLVCPACNRRSWVRLRIL